MDFSISDEHQQLLSSFRSFLDREVRPVEERYRPQLQEDDFTEEMKQAGLALRRRSAELGFYAAHMPESVGGGGLSNLGYTLLVEQGGKTGLRFGAFVLGPPNPEAPTPILMDLPKHLHSSTSNPWCGARPPCASPSPSRRPVRTPRPSGRPPALRTASGS